jgi:hypothetical protein
MRCCILGSNVKIKSSKCEKYILKNMKLVMSKVLLLHGYGMIVFITVYMAQQK